MKARRCRLTCEELIARVAPSVTPLTPLSDPLAGQAHGGYTVASPTLDGGTDLSLQGTANLNGLSASTVNGTIHTVGFVAYGYATGSLTITNVTGSVTLSLVGPEQRGFSSAPAAYRFSVVGSTGSVAGLSDQGIMELTTDSAGNWTAALSEKLLSGTGQGTVTITQPIPDAGTQYSFSGTADLAGFGSSTITGIFKGLGFISQGNATGTLTVTNGEETVILSLVGPTQSGMAKLPGSFSVNIVSADGQSSLGLGTANFAFDANNNATISFLTPAVAFAPPFAGSAVHAGNLVDFLYHQYLNRDADPQGRSFWVSQIQNGSSTQQLAASFLSSPEYLQSHGGSDTTFIQSLYSKILERTGSSDEVASWLALKNRGWSNAEIANVFLSSEEEYALVVKHDYLAYLGRAPEATGLSAWLDALDGGKLTLDQVAQQFLNSPEYLSKLGAAQ